MDEIGVLHYEGHLFEIVKPAWAGGMGGIWRLKPGELDFEKPSIHDQHERKTDGAVRADQVFIATAYLMATRSTCERGSVGAVAVQERRIVATGYNGAPPGQPHCTDDGVGCDLSAGDESGCQRAIHAEANLVAWAARAGVRLQGAVVYATHSPCKKCAELLLSCGIDEFHYSKQYRLGEAGMLTRAGVYVVDHGGATYWPESVG